MSRICLRQLKPSDERYFARWWRDRELIALTSGVFDSLSDEVVHQYFLAMRTDAGDYHRMITLGGTAIGHIALVKRPRDWYETQIVIGEKKYWGKGLGTKAIAAMLRRAHDEWGIAKVFLEVRRDNARAIRAYEKCGFRAVMRGGDDIFLRMEI